MERKARHIVVFFKNQPKGNIWSLNKWGIISMLRRLEKKSGLLCNPHMFRRTFACLLRKSGLDVMTIKDLGRWEGRTYRRRNFPKKEGDFSTVEVHNFGKYSGKKFKGEVSVKIPV